MFAFVKPVGSPSLGIHDGREPNVYLNGICFSTHARAYYCRRRRRPAFLVMMFAAPRQDEIVRVKNQHTSVCLRTVHNDI